MPTRPEHPSPWRKLLLAPLALLYAAGSALHRRVGLRPKLPPPRLPLIVIGSLRAGGAGKTSVVNALARRFTAQGLRVAVLAYRIHRPGEVEVGPDSDWRASSDEAVLSARESGARVFATRDRAATWRRLAASGAFDLAISDDGLMDARLAGAFRIALVRPGERPGLFDLLPAGPYRLTAAALAEVDLVLTGPLPPAPTPDPSANPPRPWFSREPVLPAGLDLSKRYALLSGMGNPGAFRVDLERAGVRIAGMTTGPDHGLPNPEKARREAHRAGAAGFLCSAKDAVKLAGSLNRGEVVGTIGERVTFSPAFLEALTGFRGPSSS